MPCAIIVDALCYYCGCPVLLLWMPCAIIVDALCYYCGCHVLLLWCHVLLLWMPCAIIVVPCAIIVVPCAIIVDALYYYCGAMCKVPVQIGIFLIEVPPYQKETAVSLQERSSRPDS